MPTQSAKKFAYEDINNGALILLLLRECKTWEALCGRFGHADPTDLETNTCSMLLYNKLSELRGMKLLDFEEQIDEGGRKTLGSITVAKHWGDIRVALGGVSLHDIALLSRSARGMAVEPLFGRPGQTEEGADIFVLMPFNSKLKAVYTEHIKPLGAALGVNIRRADDFFSPKPFMFKVWEGICSARLVIADCTEKNPNVFYEIGMAHTVGKPVVLITRSEKDIPSDIKHIDFIEYAYDPEGAKDLTDKLALIIREQLALNPPESGRI
jgi:hypothetical protein